MTEASTDEEALTLVMNVLQRIADDASSALRGDIDEDGALCEINNLARNTIDALATRTFDPVSTPSGSGK